mgnify:FL=1
MDIVESAQHISQDLNTAIYGDGGRCGCNVHRRRLLFFLLGIGFLIGALVSVLAGQTSAGPPLACVGVVWWACGIVCPNGPCGQYSATKKAGCLTVAENEYYYASYCCGAARSAPQGEASGLLNTHTTLSDTARRNMESVRAFIATYNGECNRTEAELDSFIRNTYSETYVSTATDGVQRTIGELSKAWRDAREKGWQAQRLVFYEVADDHVAYGYELVGATWRLPINAFATFETAGVFKSAVYVKRQKQ